MICPTKNCILIKLKGPRGNRTHLLQINSLPQSQTCQRAKKELNRSIAVDNQLLGSQRSFARDRKHHTTQQLMIVCMSYVSGASVLLPLSCRNTTNVPPCYKQTTAQTTQVIKRLCIHCLTMLNHERNIAVSIVVHCKFPFADKC